ncbi:MAG: virulence protein RhuM/Fic/DOC family protein [Kiritimatiellaeota bacterium]|nr:virulence protein RhuM/Fic/DOC family protein [Kiritimatiellota bacterium]
MRKSTKKALAVREAPVGYNASAVVLYQAANGRVDLSVRLEQNTLWLNQHQMAELFDVGQSAIAKHIRNIFEIGELDKNSVYSKLAYTALDGKIYQTGYYNLDMIISVGYRVNSVRGTQFRIWATQVLRDHILKGCSINERRLKELRQSIRLVANVLEHYDVTTDQAKAIIQVVVDYEKALDILDDYDHQRVRPAGCARSEAQGIGYDEALKVIAQMREKFGGSELFGREKDNSLQGSLAAVMQSFGGQDVYPSKEEKAAHLLYFLVKNHSFVDGNKRIAATLFLWFLEKNRLMFREDGTRRIAENALVAITLMIAESKPAEKETICQLVTHLIA